MHMFRKFVFCLLFLLMIEPAWSLPAVGSPAPPLHVGKVLQPSIHTNLNWAALRGKTVVLEFWATWCGPCVASISHINEVESALDPSRFTFIAIDDEDETVVKTFIQRRAMAGAIVLDNHGATYKAFGVSSRPTTIVIDGSGHVAILTQPDKLDAKMLLAVAAHKLPPTTRASRNSATTMPTTTSLPQEGIQPPHAHQTEPLFDLSIRPAKAGSESVSMRHDGTNIWWEGMDSQSLFSLVYKTPPSRIVFLEALPKGRYDMALQLDGLDPVQSAPLMQSAVKQAFGVDVEEKLSTANALVLTQTPDTKRLLQTPASTSIPELCIVRNGKLQLYNCSISGAAKALEGFLNEPVIDETGLIGRFDGEVNLSSTNLQSVAQQLNEGLGLMLQESTRPIKSLIVTKRNK